MTGTYTKVDECRDGSYAILEEINTDQRIWAWNDGTAQDEQTQVNVGTWSWHEQSDTYSVAPTKTVEKSDPLARLDAWAQKGRSVTIMGAGFYQPGDGFWIELKQSSYRGATPRKVHVSDFELGDTDDGQVGTLAEIIEEALRRWDDPEYKGD